MAGGGKVTIRTSTSYGFLVVADMATAFLWVFLNAMARVAVDLGFTYLDGAAKQFLKKGFVVGLLFLFYGLSKLTNGATYNPITVLAYSAAGITHHSLSVLSLRIPAQIVGAMFGASAAVSSSPAIYEPMMTGPFLRVDRHVGAMVEGVLTFAVVFIALATSLKGPKSGIRRTWITSISRVSLSVLGAEYTGPAMNPANAFSWAYLKNQHNTWEHIYVYWIAPILATLAAAWVVRTTLVFSKVKEKKA
ncbi:hypothetical protein GOP47_0025735 [Adiantum capillus-veneris]|uniref:Uncharacterized protein n=1 Tax=Adiantum capillus-veneris TaxID=13818 RepID=A0A9D4U3A0_ADICA|nr:hypothetical protein GOP47_0025735 [Adiantum capillus-veneris]